MRLIVVNDRCFVDPEPAGPDGVRGTLDTGGLAWALTRTDRPALFVSSARTPEQAALSARGGVDVTTPDGTFRVRLVRTDETAYRAFYDVAANRMLWLAHHGAWERSTAADLAAYEGGYRTVNENLARAVAEEIGGGAQVLWQDYQTYLAPALVRRLLPPAVLERTVLQHFLHVPFPGPAAWRGIPAPVVRELLTGLLGNDLVCFQTAAYAAAFAECCRAFLATEAGGGRVLAPDGRWVRLAVHPIPPCAGHLHATVASGRTGRHRAELAASAHGRRTVFRTERIDPVKDFPDALRAFDRLLRRPGLAGTARYVAQLVPARMSIPDWVTARDEAVRVAAEVNARWPGGPPPVELRVERNFGRVVAAYQDYDVLDVVPRADGMNLVALEGPLVNERDGGVVLSTAAGAYGRLAPHALGVPPGDVDRHADALEAALRMPASERAARAAGLRDAAAGDPVAWLRAQLADGVTAARGRR